MPVSPAAAAPAASPLQGRWSFRGETGERPLIGTLVFEMEATGLGGAYLAPNGKATRMADLRLSGNRIAFDIVGPASTWHLEGTVSGDRISGTFQTLQRTVPWTAVKLPPSPTLTPSPRNH